MFNRLPQFLRPKPSAHLSAPEDGTIANNQLEPVKSKNDLQIVISIKSPNVPKV